MNKSITLAILIFGVCFGAYSGGSKENYTAKTDIQYMQPNWNESWHTLTTDTAFTTGETFYLNVDVAVAAEVVKDMEIGASVSFLSPIVCSTIEGIEKVDGPQGAWNTDNVGTRSYGFKVPVSKHAIDKTSGKPAYTNVSHLQFRVTPDVAGEQKVRITYGDPIAASFNREFILSIAKDSDHESKAINNNLPICFVNSTSQGFTMLAPNESSLFIGDDGNGKKTISLISDACAILLEGSKSASGASLEYTIKKTNSITGAIETVASGTFSKNHLDSKGIRVSEADYSKKEFEKQLESFLIQLRQGTRIDITIKETDAFFKSIGRIFTGNAFKKTDSIFFRNCSGVLVQS